MIVATVTRRYSALAIASVAILLAAGVVNTWFLTGTVPALVGTAYGRLLLTKIGFFIAMLIVAAVNLFRLAPRLAAGAAGNALWRTIAQLGRNARVETGPGSAFSLSLAFSALYRRLCTPNPDGRSRCGSTSPP